MAQGGAGTIDQALLTVLPSPYQSLRLFGLHGKVLVVDEIHAFDAFALRELAALIELHAMLSGSTILMSATLPLETRQKLTGAHDRGRGLSPRTLGERAYPLLTCVDDGSVEEKPVALADRSRRRVAVERIDDIEAAEDMLAQAAASGAAVALIRSTVDTALASCDRLRRRLGDDRVDLLHSRFLPRDRLRIESDMLRRFGRSATPADRRGRVLVATQVIEQSLDVDFDAMFTDLAPVDLLIQRAGRLWRHDRGDRPVAAPVLRVISPAPGDDDRADWLKAKAKEVGWVYRDTARLWLTARRIFDGGAIVVETLASAQEQDGHVRCLVDSVYGAEEGALPTESLREARRMAEGASSGHAERARFAALAAARGYVINSRCWEAEGVVRTRLEEPGRAIVRLARRHAGALVPMGVDWAGSEISVTEHWASDLLGPDDSKRGALQPPWGDADEGIRIVVFEESDGPWRSRTPDLVYDRKIGLAQLSAPASEI